VIKATPAADTSLVVSLSREGEVSVFDSQTQALLTARLKRTLQDAKITRDGSLLAIAPKGLPIIQVWNIHERMSGRRFVDVLDKNLITRVKGRTTRPISCATPRSAARTGRSPSTRPPIRTAPCSSTMRRR
jgi:hypothetical protein